MMGLTAKQRQLYEFLLAFIGERGTAPNFEEMMVATGLKSKNGIFRLLEALEHRGLIRRIPNCARAIDLVSQESPGEHVKLHPEVYEAARIYARRHHMTLPTALAIAARAFFVRDKAA